MYHVLYTHHSLCVYINMYYAYVIYLYIIEREHLGKRMKSEKQREDTEVSLSNVSMSKELTLMLNYMFYKGKE